MNVTSAYELDLRDVRDPRWAAGEDAGGRREFPSRETLDAVLQRALGQRAALTGFVRWLRETHEVALALPSKNGATASRRRRETARQYMLALLREGADAYEIAIRWRTAALVYFHDLTVKASGMVRDEDIEAELDGLRVKIGGEGH